MEQSESPECTAATTLDRVGLKRRCRIVGVRAAGAFRKRVLAMGMLPRWRPSRPPLSATPSSTG
ncbi:MAG TPA: hypothetical protein PLI76_09070 [Methanoculleus sp.]|nr:hypothetical protein [Methanoculleus sp.]